MLKEFRERLSHDTQALEAAGLLKRERIIGSAQGPVVRLADGRALCARTHMQFEFHSGFAAQLAGRIGQQMIRVFLAPDLTTHMFSRLHFNFPPLL